MYIKCSEATRERRETERGRVWGRNSDREKKREWLTKKTGRWAENGRQKERDKDIQIEKETESRRHRQITASQRQPDSQRSYERNVLCN